MQNSLDHIDKSKCFVYNWPWMLTCLQHFWQTCTSTISVSLFDFTCKLVCLRYERCWQHGLHFCTLHVVKRNHLYCYLLITDAHIHNHRCYSAKFRQTRKWCPCIVNMMSLTTETSSVTTQQRGQKTCLLKWSIMSQFVQRVSEAKTHQLLWTVRHRVSE